MDNIPEIEDVISVKQEINALQYADKGGFKAVIKGNISEKEEAIKLISINTFRKLAEI